MKRLAVVAVMLMVGASIAFASSLACPWYVDNAPINVGTSPPANNTQTLVYLKNNKSSVIECSIAYYSQSGMFLGPLDPKLATFRINPNAAVIFRPVVKDNAVAQGGQEDDEGAKVPDRPRDVETKKNGTFTVRFQGAPTDLQGAVTGYTTPTTAGAQSTTFAFLLPPGA